MVVGDLNNNRSTIYDISKNTTIDITGSFADFSPDAQHIATTEMVEGRESRTQLYDLAGHKIIAFEGHFSGFSADGARIATYTGPDNQTRVYSLQGREIVRLPGQGRQFSKDGQQFETTSYPQQIARTYSLNSPNLFSQVNQSITLSQANQRIILSSAGGGIQMYDLAGNEIAAFSGQSARLTPGEKQLSIYFEKDDSTRLYDFSGREQLRLTGTLVRTSPDGDYVVTKTTDRERDNLTMYDSSGRVIISSEGSTATFSPDGQWLITSSFSRDDLPSRLYNISGEQIATLEIGRGDRALFSADGQQIFISSNLDNNRTDVYSLSGQKVDELSGRYLRSLPGDRFATFDTEGEEGRTRIYDAAGQVLASFDGRITGMSPDGQRLLSVPLLGGSRSRLRDASGKEIRSFNGASVQFVQGHQKISVYDADTETSRFYDYSGEPVGPVLQGTFGGYAPDNQSVVTSLANEDISQIYDVSGNLLAEFPGAVHERRVGNFIGIPAWASRLGFAFDGDHLLTQTEDGDYHLWQLDEGLDDLLARGCDWVRPYLKDNLEENRAAFCR